jgi:hypothetical protein
MTYHDEACSNRRPRSRAWPLRRSSRLAIAQNSRYASAFWRRARHCGGPGRKWHPRAQWAAERFNAGGGIAGRKIELVIEEETSPKDTIERFSKLVQQEKVDCVQGNHLDGAAWRSDRWWRKRAR